MEQQNTFKGLRMRIKSRPKDLDRLIKLLTPSELDLCKNTASPFGMEWDKRKKYELSVSMGYNEYGFASAMNSFYFDGKGISGNVGGPTELFAEDMEKFYPEALI